MLDMTTLAGALVLVLVSLVTPPTSRSFDQVAEALSHERDTIEGTASGETVGKPIDKLTTPASN